MDILYFIKNLTLSQIIAMSMFTLWVIFVIYLIINFIKIENEKKETLIQIDKVDKMFYKRHDYIRDVFRRNGESDDRSVDRGRNWKTWNDIDTWYNRHTTLKSKEITLSNLNEIFKDELKPLLREERLNKLLKI